MSQNNIPLTFLGLDDLYAYMVTNGVTIEKTLKMITSGRIIVGNLTDLKNKYISYLKKKEGKKILYINPFDVEGTREVVQLAALLDKHKQDLEHWYATNPTKMKKSVMTGKVFRDKIKDTRARGSNYMQYGAFKLNVNLNPNKIGSEDLTRARFFALVHYFLGQKAFDNPATTATFNISPLVQKVIFDEENVLTTWRFYLGTGFQYLGQLLTKTTADKVKFHIGCALLDYLSTKSTNSPRYKDCVGFTSFGDYFFSDETAKGDTFIAGARNIKDINLSAFMVEGMSQFAKESVRNIKIDM